MYLSTSICASDCSSVIGCTSPAVWSESSDSPTDSSEELRLELKSVACKHRQQIASPTVCCHQVFPPSESLRPGKTAPRRDATFVSR